MDTTKPQEVKAINFTGNDKWIAILLEDSLEKYSLLFGYVNNPRITVNREQTLDCLYPHSEVQFICDLLETNRTCYHIISLHNKKEYDTIICLLESIL